MLKSQERKTGLPGKKYIYLNILIEYFFEFVKNTENSVNIILGFQGHFKIKWLKN